MLIENTNPGLETSTALGDILRTTDLSGLTTLPPLARTEYN